jgi:asparagine synthase (glutamine-hydrolysing)
MCGIAGFIGRGDLDTLRRMTTRIAHRGPDEAGHWRDEAAGVHLGFRRLSIVDLAGGSQPMHSACAKCGALTITFNGEIYNHAELRAQLIALGHTFATDHSDTEVLLHAYREWGEGFVGRLNGMWAFVIYDRARRRIFGSRDRFGKKPLYWFFERGTFAWASELPALAEHPDCPRSLDALSLKKYFAYCFIPAPRSIYERVSKLPGGHSFSFELDADAMPRVWRWWEFVIEPDDRWLSVGDLIAAGKTKGNRINRDWNELVAELSSQLRATLEAATKRRLMADVPLGVFLSGGIDSSAIAAFAARHVPAGQLSTFSIGFREKSFDESEYAQLVATTLGTRHHHDTLDLETSRALLPGLVARLDEPLGDSSLLPTFLLSKFTRQHVTVALGGDGGDELFAGYDPMKALRAAERYSRWMPRPVHTALKLLAGLLPVSHANVSFDFKVKRFLRGVSHTAPLWNSVWMGALDPSGIAELFREPCDAEEIYSEAISAWDACAQPNVVDRSLQWWTNLYLQDGILAKVDRASMLCSLEARSPFLDIEVANLARRIPHQLKLRGGETKWILKKALRGVIPDKIIDRPKKGFGMPIGRWLREGKFDFDLAAAPPCLNRVFIEQQLAAHAAGKRDERLFLWCHWLLTQWLGRAA